MPVFISVSADEERVEKLMDSMYEEFIAEFASSLNEMSSREDMLADILKTSIGTERHDMADVVQKLWEECYGDTGDELQPFKARIANSSIRDFVLEELDDCGLEAHDMSDAEEVIIYSACYAIAEHFIYYAPYVGEGEINTLRFKEKIIDVTLSSTYRKLTGQDKIIF